MFKSKYFRQPVKAEGRFKLADRVSQYGDVLCLAFREKEMYRTPIISGVTAKNLAIFSVQGYCCREMQTFRPIKVPKVTHWRDKSEVSAVTIAVQYAGQSARTCFMCLQKEYIILWFAFGRVFPVFLVSESPVKEN